MNGAQVGIFEETNKVSFACFLESHYSAALEPEVGLEILGNFTNQSLERKLANEKLSRLLVSTNFSQSDGSWSVTMRLLDATSCWSTLACCLGGELFSWSFSTGRLSCCLLGSCHFV
uniref:Uncharacterized protein n=1 Tax=Ciona savignyi TaxID=51511 RepID=H2Z6S0_CIOSA